MIQLATLSNQTATPSRPPPLPSRLLAFSLLRLPFASSFVLLLLTFNQIKAVNMFFPASKGAPPHLQRVNSSTAAPLHTCKQFNTQHFNLNTSLYSSRRPVTDSRENSKLDSSVNSFSQLSRSILCTDNICKVLALLQQQLEIIKQSTLQQFRKMYLEFPVVKQNQVYVKQFTGKYKAQAQAALNQSSTMLDQRPSLSIDQYSQIKQIKQLQSTQKKNEQKTPRFQAPSRNKANITTKARQRFFTEIDQEEGTKKFQFTFSKETRPSPKVSAFDVGCNKLREFGNFKIVPIVSRRSSNKLK